MAGNTVVNGKKTSCMVKAYSYMKMVEPIKEILKMIRNMGMAFIFGKVGRDTKAIGNPVNNMVKGNTFRQTVNLELAFGKMADA